jgi:hypothetical protein
MHDAALQWGYVKFSTHSHCNVIRAYDAADNVIETPEQKGRSKESN